MTFPRRHLRLLTGDLPFENANISRKKMGPLLRCHKQMHTQLSFFFTVKRERKTEKINATCATYGKFYVVVQKF